MSDTTQRVHQIAGIRELADWLESHPEVPIPYALSGQSEYAYELIHARHGDGQQAVIAAVARALPGKVDKRAMKTDDSVFTLDGQLPGGVRIKVVADRDSVCERVVTGTREVTKTIPDPMVTVPTIEVTEVVEDVEWVCGSVLAGKS